jgi:hypothetical protein
MGRARGRGGTSPERSLGGHTKMRTTHVHIARRNQRIVRSHVRAGVCSRSHGEPGGWRRGKIKEQPDFLMQPDFHQSWTQQKKRP